MATDAKPKAGLEDVVAGESAICYLDGDRGVLAYQGFDIHDLANADRGASFEECCFLLWHGRLPTRAELGDLQSQLASARILPETVLRFMRSLPNVDGMDALRTMTSVLGHFDPDAQDRTPQANYRKAVRLTGQIGSIVATWGRMAAGGGPIDPDPALGLYFTFTVFYALANEIYGTLPFLVLFQFGFLYTGLTSIVQQFGDDVLVKAPQIAE